MTKREQRVIKAFEKCIEDGTYSVAYAVTLIEDNQRYGYLTDAAKDEFYAWLDEWEEQHKPPVVEPVEEEQTEIVEEVAE